MTKKNVSALRERKSNWLCTGIDETWWKKSAHCGWQSPCSGAHGRLRVRGGRRSIGSFPNTGTEAQLRRAKYKNTEKLAENQFILKAGLHPGQVTTYQPPSCSPSDPGSTG